MKKFILSMTMLVLVLCLKTNVSNAAEISAMERLDYWDVSKEYTITNQDATYHAYLSKDKKESWIFKADVAKDKKNVKVVIPDKIENAPVVIVGATSGYDEILATHAAVMFSSSTPWRTSPSTAPPSSLLTIISLNLEATIPTFIPSGATTFPSNTLICLMFFPPVIKMFILYINTVYSLFTEI